MSIGSEVGTVKHGRTEAMDAIQQAAGMLRKMQAPDMRLVAINKELELLDKELEREHQTQRVQCQFHASTYDTDRRIKDLYLRLELAINRYHDLAGGKSHGKETENTAKESGVHSLNVEERAMGKGDGSKKELPPSV